MIDNQELFKKYAPKIQAIAICGNFDRDTIVTPDFLLEKEASRYENIEICYVPFESINENAQVVLIGITPGWTQMKEAYKQVGQDLNKGLTLEEIFCNSDKQASFAGTMRTNLVDMLDELGLQKALGIGSCSSLFSDNYDLAHTTSAIRYPVFVNGENYTGHRPDILDSPLLRRYISEVLSKELQIVSGALIIPLGKSSSDAIRYLVNKGLVNPDRCLFNFPHPSGANGHRQKQFDQMKPQLKQKIINWFNNTK